MTPEQKLKHIILALIASDADQPAPEATAENIDELYDEADSDSVQEAKYEIRTGEVDTGLLSQVSRHYECREVAAKAPDGSWIGWTYWYGGGKHGEPEAIDWMNEAYQLDCAEEEKMTIVRTFSKAA